MANADTIDNVIVNDAGTDKTITTSGHVTVIYKVTATNTGGLVGCDASDGSPVTLAINVPSQVVASTNQLTFNSCGPGQSVTFASGTPSSGPGYAIGHSASDIRGNYNISSLNFNLKVVAAPTTPTDSTPPSVTPVVTGTLGLNGWYTSDVTVGWEVTDGESVLTSKTGCDSVTITEDQAETTYTCAAISAGGTTTKSVSVKRDATAPVITPGDMNSQDWRNGSLSQSFAASDAMSGIVSADESFTLTASADSANSTTPTSDSRTVTDAAGNSTTRTVSAWIDTVAPEVSPDSLVDSTWRKTDLSEDFQSSDALSGLADQADANFTLTASEESADKDTPTVVSRTVHDVAGNATTRTLSALIDRTAPQVTPDNVVNTNWRNTDLTEGFGASDRLSGLADSADAMFSLTASEESVDENTPTVVSRTVSDVVGNETTRTLSALIDKTAPTVSPSSVVSTTWRSTDLSEEFRASDGLSGLADSADASFSLTASEESADENTPTVVSKIVYDRAGNAIERSVSALIDKTGPTGVAINGGPQAGGKYFPNNVPQATCSAGDALSGVAADGCVVSGYSTAVGTHTLVATATDRAGNVTQVTGPTYTVRTLTLTGFYAPVDKGIHNTVKGGATVPLKFEVFDQGVEVTGSSVVKSFTTKTVSCTTSTSEDAVEELAGQAGTTLRYDAIGGQFIQNWQTAKKPGTCYEVRMTTVDDSSISATFKLK